MLQSMVERPTPTRAEVSDVANAILDTADAIMLSAETAVGPYPVEAVQMMNRVAEQTETYLARRKKEAHVEAPAIRRVTTAVAHGASVLADELNVKLVAVWTETGNTARVLSKHRLSAMIVGLSPDEAVCRRMAMYYGVRPVRMQRNPSVNQMLDELDSVLVARRLAAIGDLILVVAGTHLDEPGATNSLLIHLVGTTGPPR
jgi:pyruvate kinase